MAIVGGTGQLGVDCVELFREEGHVPIALDRAGADLRDPLGIERALSLCAAEIVVNTAAMTDVPGCERNPQAAFELNAIGARNVARAASRAGARLVHISTDYVFDGRARAPYREDDLPLPLNVYGNSKLSGEHFALAETDDVVILRSSGLYGRSPSRGKGGRNFVQTMLHLAREQGEVRVVVDEIVTPTYTRDLARQLVAVAESELRGVVHATCQGSCSWHEFASAIFDRASIGTRVLEARAAEFPSVVRRPSYSVLENARLQRAGLDLMPNWSDSLDRYLADVTQRAPTGEV